jgi:hypothetical protein
MINETSLNADSCSGIQEKHCLLLNLKLNLLCLTSHELGRYSQRTKIIIF